MKSMTLESFRALVRVGSVKHVFLMPYPDADGGGWYWSTDHSDRSLSRELATKSGSLRVFKTSDAAINALRACHYTGLVSVTMNLGVT